MATETSASTLCGVAAVSQLGAGLTALSVWTSTDFENGTRTAGGGAAAVMATALSVIGIFCALAAIFRPKAGPLACGIGTFLLLGGCVTGLLLLPLMGHYG
jgi:hypothetical protein